MILPEISVGIYRYIIWLMLEERGGEKKMPLSSKKRHTVTAIRFPFLFHSP